MASRSDKQPTPDAARDEAMRIARGIQRPGQTRAQTRLIAQGIQKGIAQYKKQHSARARELDKKLKKVEQQLATPAMSETEVQVKVVYRQHWLPWALLAPSWLAVSVCWLVC